ncbi:hypothetical protein D910_09467 [Dendroctonus ponderosae]
MTVISEYKSNQVKRCFIVTEKFTNFSDKASEEKKNKMLQHKKLRNRYEEDCASHAHLEEMILREQVEGGMVATDALLWLRRALHFLSQFFECIIMDSESERATQDLVPMMQQAYSETLEPYHGWLGTQLMAAAQSLPVLQVMSRFAPNRSDLFYTLALDHSHRDEQVLRDLRQYHQRMAACVLQLTQFYADHRLEDGL